MTRAICLVAIMVMSVSAMGADRPDIVVNDFEGPTYGDWTVTGEAFGPGPAQGTLPGQMRVWGFEGNGLANSFNEGDKTVGTLTSPPFKIERTRLDFLIGAGYHPGETCINLLVDGKIVRTATGTGRTGQDTEMLRWETWDVADLEGTMAQIQIVDTATGGWGHINIDSITQSDKARGLVHTSREVTIDRDWLVVNMPAVADKTSGARITMLVDGKIAREIYFGRLAKTMWVSYGIKQWKGKRATLDIAEQVAPDGSTPVSASVTQADQPRGIVMATDTPYSEIYRPQFHFTPRENWTNDPNGLMFYRRAGARAGEYHMFFQHNPEGRDWGNMTWGHAVSPDLVHWTQLDNAIYPDKLGTIFSGSGVVDWNNTAGFQTGEEKVLVCIYTSAGEPFTQSIAYSNDGGRTWTKYAGNPVVPHILGGNRDPKVLWYEPEKKWVMALYLDGNDYALLSSPNLKVWTKMCDVHVEGNNECPDFFQLAVDGDANNKRWVFWGATSTYLIGSFDGTKFTPESGPHQSNWGGNSYAAQTWSDIPPSDGRRIQITWMAGGEYPGMPFNQQFSFPCELSLHTTPEGIRLFRKPIREIELLHGKKHGVANVTLHPGDDPLKGVEGDLFDVRLKIEPGSAAAFGFVLRGELVMWTARDRQISALGRTAPLEPVDGVIKLQVLLDRTSLEVFGNDGLIAMPTCFLPDLTNHQIGFFAIGGDVKVRKLEAYELRSAWEKP